MASSYQPIENYGIIGNMRTAALVGMNGSIDWLCLPHFDSPSVFAAILDAEKGGRFRIAPSGDDFRNKQFYWPDTNILITRFLHADGIGEIEDYMPVGAVGASPDQLVRRVRVVRGRCRSTSSAVLHLTMPAHHLKFISANMAPTSRVPASRWDSLRQCRCVGFPEVWSPISRSARAKTSRSSCAAWLPRMR